MNRILNLLYVFLLAGLLVWPAAGCGRSQSDAGQGDSKQPARVVKVSVEKVEPHPIKDVLILPGETRPWRDVKVAADWGGRVEWIGPREGEAVKKGQLLAKIDVSTLKAALDNARAAYNLANDLYMRRKRLFERKIISREELDRSETDRAVKLGALRQAEVQYRQGLLYCPIDGLVNHLYVDPGEFVDRGRPVADLVNMDQVEIDVNVPEMDVRYLKVGQQSLVLVDALPDQKFIGRIDFVAFKADPATKTFRVKVLVDNAEGNIRPVRGFSGRR